MKSLLSQVLGRTEIDFETVAEAAPSRAPVREDVPVPCAALPRTTFRDRLRRNRVRGDGAGSRAVGKVMGESEKDSLVPRDAEELEMAGHPFKKDMKPVRDVVLEPRDPYADKEKMLTPSAALVAPDVTPDAMTPLDPIAPSGARFRASDIAEEPNHHAQPEVPAEAMDAVLGRRTPSRENPPVDRVVSADEAYRMLNVPSPTAQALMESSPGGDALLNQGNPMPDHRHSDGKQILEAFRKFV